MNGSPSRALVLGGGGSCGNAWLIGVLAGLAEAGLDVTGADLIVGTSAGATAAAQLGFAPLDELMASTQVAVPSRAAGAASRPAADPIERLRTLIAASSGVADFRRRVGASSIAAAGPDWSLTAGHDRVLVLSPLGGRSLHPVEWGTHLAGQVDALRAAGSVVETVFPDAAASPHSATT